MSVLIRTAGSLKETFFTVVAVLMPILLFAPMGKALFNSLLEGMGFYWRFSLLPLTWYTPFMALGLGLLTLLGIALMVGAVLFFIGYLFYLVVDEDGNSTFDLD